MRRVAAYCKRHLAQEGHMKDQKSEEELKHTKSTISLKVRLLVFFLFCENKLTRGRSELGA